MTEAVSSSCYFFLVQKCAVLMDCLFEVSSAQIWSDICIAKENENLRSHSYAIHIYIYMYTENKTEGERWIHCVMRLSPPGVIFFASNAHPLPPCGWEAHARRSAAKPDHLHAYFSEQSAHTRRGLQLSGFCPEIWGDMYTTTHKQNIYTYIYINIYIYIYYVYSYLYN